MTKIKSIKVQNFKALEHQEVNFNGMSAIITAGNNKGKTSLLRGLIDRFQGEKADVIVKEGEEKGENTVELTDGSTIGWKFTKKSETFFYTTPDDIKMTTGVLSKIGEKYFGNRFDIDKFVTSSQNEQTKQVQKLLGIDLEELDAKHKVVFDKRTVANRELKRLKDLKIALPEEITAPDIESLKTEKEQITTDNAALKSQWEIDNTAHQKEAIEFNEIQTSFSNGITHYSNALDDMKKYQGRAVASFIDFKGIQKALDDIPEPKEHKELTTLKEPIYGDFAEIDLKIETAIENKAKFENYETDLADYNSWVKDGTAAKELVEKLKEQLDKINADKFEVIKKANLPKEFEIGDDGILYNGLPLDNNQISSSAKYICALKLGYLALGKIRCLHFDASFLDNNSLRDVQEWAESKDLQLLIERPEMSGGDITYEIIQNL
ncbi:MAG: hypothetical protein QM499_00810 [Flavobacteriaceae bacterium]